MEQQTDCPAWGSSRPPTKKERVLASFVAGDTQDRWSAARSVRDWCLHSTVSELERDGISIERWPATAPGAFGPVHYREYRLRRDEVNVNVAKAMLNLLRVRRGATSEASPVTGMERVA